MDATQQYILEELRAIRLIAESIASDENRMMKVPDASRKLGIGKAKLRELCKAGVIPCTKLSGEKRPQYLINIPGALNALSRGGYLMRPDKKRKSTLDLTQ